MSRLHVIICDTHRTMREALAGYLCSQPEVASARVAGNADDAIRLARQGGDVLVLDLMLGAGSTGLDVLEALGNLGVSIPVLVISGSDTLDDVARALSLGALGFCHKSVRPQTLYEATLQVASGQAVIPDVAVAPLLRKLRQEQRTVRESSAVLARLTVREREVLRLLSQGVNRVTIARRMNLSINTVRTHLRHLMGKLGVNTELAAAARGRELLETAQRPSQKRWTTEDAPIDLRAYELKDRLGS